MMSEERMRKNIQWRDGERMHARKIEKKKYRTKDFELHLVARLIFIALWTSVSPDSLRYDAARTFLTRYFNVYKCIVLIFVRKSRLKRTESTSKKEESERRTRSHKKKSHQKWFGFERRNVCRTAEEFHSWSLYSLHFSFAVSVETHSHTECARDMIM